jgi:hypothetical protein
MTMRLNISSGDLAHGLQLSPLYNAKPQADPSPHLSIYSTCSQCGLEILESIYQSLYVQVFSLTKRSPNRSKCSRTMMVYLTNSSTQSTKRPLLPPGIIREPPSSVSSFVKSSYDFGTDDWLGIAKHAHPSPEDVQTIDCVEGLQATRNHRYAERTALRWSDSPGAERNPVDLVFEHRRGSPTNTFDIVISGHVYCLYGTRQIRRRSREQRKWLWQYG